MDLLALLILVFLWIYTMIKYSSLPGTIPVHYNLQGGADRLGSRNTVWIIPAVASVIFTGVSLLIRHLARTKVKYNRQVDSKKSPGISIQLFRVIRLVIVTAFTFVNIKVIRQSPGLEPWFLPAFITSMLLPTFYFIFLWYKRKQPA
jgi:uncharacterized membrane protein